MTVQRLPLPQGSRLPTTSTNSSSISSSSTSNNPLSLLSLCLSRSWHAAGKRATTHPHEAALTPHTSSPSKTTSGVTPLLLSIRHNAPPSTILSILAAHPPQILSITPTNATPLHEAALQIDSLPLIVFQRLLQVDASFKSRAATTQDVDGCTPLHILIRSVFYSTPLHTPHHWNVLREFIISCPQACSIADWREYEETPLILTLKAGSFCPKWSLTLENLLHRTVQLMLQHHPRCLEHTNGSNIDYTPLHSAIFHGRCAETVALVLRGLPVASVERRTKAGGETALTFAAMRNENERVFRLLLGEETSCDVVRVRDMLGMCPGHWLWVRLVGRVDVWGGYCGEYETGVERLCLEEEEDWFRDEGPVGQEIDVHYHETNRAVDPPLNFRQMRHIPPDYVSFEDDCITAVVRLLLSARSKNKPRHLLSKSSKSPAKSLLDYYHQCGYTRDEIVVSLFWNKMIHILTALHRKDNITTSLPSPTPQKRRRLSTTTIPILHTAAGSASTPPSVLRIASSLYPHHFQKRDHRGQLPLHRAAQRSKRHVWTLPSLGGHVEETLDEAVGLCLDGWAAAARVVDGRGRLPLHYAVESVVRGIVEELDAGLCDMEHEDDIKGNQTNRADVKTTIHDLMGLIKAYPESLERRDGLTKLYPFLLASSVAVEYKRMSSDQREELTQLSVVYELMRFNPAVLLGLGCGTPTTER